MPTGKVAPDPGTHATVGLGSTMSVAVGSAKATIVPFWPAAGVVTGAGMPLSTGGAVSTTSTVNVDDEWFPLASWALHVTLVVPSANTEPDGGVHTRLGLGSTASVAANVIAAPAELVAGVVALGETIDGAVVSCTVTVKDG